MKTRLSISLISQSTKLSIYKKKTNGFFSYRNAISFFACIFLVELSQSKSDTSCPAKTHISKKLFQLCFERGFNRKSSQNLLFLLRPGKNLFCSHSAEAFILHYFIFAINFLQCHILSPPLLPDILIQLDYRLLRSRFKSSAPDFEKLRSFRGLLSLPEQRINRNPVDFEPS